MLTLPASSNRNSGINALGRMQWPVINDFWILSLSFEKLSIHIQLDIRELDLYSIMMPHIITDLRKLPAPLSWSENVKVPIREVSPQQQNKAAIPHK